MAVFLSEVPLEAVIFLGAVAFFLVLLLLFALYLNKLLCFANCGGFPCIDRQSTQNRDSSSITFPDEEEGYRHSMLTG